MIKRNLKGATLAFLLGILFAASATAAYAASASSKWFYYGPYAGYSYQNQASIYTGSGVWAYTDVQTQNWANVPANYMGAWAGLYNASTGQVVASSGNWIYNSSSSAGMSIPSSTYYSSGTYYSYGYTAAWNGSSYNSFRTYKSPSLNY